jgi:hypothetical protein
MDKDTANKFFSPASECKKLAGEYIIWKVKQVNYYANGTGNSSEDRYNCALVSKKQKDVLITNKFDRVPLFFAYVVSIEVAAKWPRWDGEDSVLGNKKITKLELMEILESM